MSAVAEKPTIRCSFLPTIAACRGALNASRGLESKSSAASEAGTRIHAWLAGERDIELAPNEQELADMFEDVDQETATDLLGDTYTTQNETALTMDFPNFVLSGHIDRVHSALDGMTEIIRDWKTGWKRTIPATDNLQGRGYMLLRWHATGCQHFYVAFATRDRDECKRSAEYTFPSILRAKKQIEEMVNEALAPDAKRTISSACHYCPAKGTARCPETYNAIVWWGAMDNAFADMGKTERVAFMRLALDSATPEQRARAIDWYLLANPVLAAFKDAVKEGMQDDPKYAEGFALAPSGSVREVRDIVKAAAKLSESGLVTDDEVRASFSMALGKIEEAAYKRGKAKDKKWTRKVSDDAVEAVLRPFIIEKPKEPIIVRVAKQEPEPLDVTAVATIDEKKG